MPAYHIHIRGLVQGVGFRPFVCRTAAAMHINGWVSNDNDGVHIECEAPAAAAMQFYKQLTGRPPAHAVITGSGMQEIPARSFTSFHIQHSSSHALPDLLLTPDRALCARCRGEMEDNTNRRYQYAFTTCLECGPRYAIITALPYDREHTTMATLPMCGQCRDEYNDVYNVRHYSQTNSCNNCAIPMHLYDAPGSCYSGNAEQQVSKVVSMLQQGRIAAVKGIGGYLLLCDAANANAIRQLRERKRRPHKPFALLYPDIASAATDVELQDAEKAALLSSEAPVVLCRYKTSAGENIDTALIAPGLKRLGILLPYAPLLWLIAQHAGRPLVATSANTSGLPIIYKDEDALSVLFDIADAVLTFDRDIVVPQDDSVVQFTTAGRRIMLRRSRGWAPNYFPHALPALPCTVLGMGGELKSAFALQTGAHVYVSQYLGSQESLEAQQSFTATLQHLLALLRVSPGFILVDKHPHYFVAQEGIALANKLEVPLVFVQHHKAHFAAVLAENNLLQQQEDVLGIIWDGTGYGEDEQVWGGEALLFSNGEIDRVAHLDYFPQLMGDKMSREPRLSALSLLRSLPGRERLVEKYFTPREWQYYQQVLQQPQPLLTSSMGRFLDGIAAMLGIAPLNTYEGEAAILLEAKAAACTQETGYYSMPLRNGLLEWQPLLQELLHDLEQHIAVEVIACKVFRSLARAVATLGNHFGLSRIAFSGGVFQNALLVDMMQEQLGGSKQLYFHQQLSPNDECIGFGQLAYFHLNRELFLQSGRQAVVALTAANL